MTRAFVFGCAVILGKYGMDGKRDTRSVETNSLKDHDAKEGDTFDDPRLDKLWNKVCPPPLLPILPSFSGYHRCESAVSHDSLSDRPRALGSSPTRSCRT